MTTLFGDKSRFAMEIGDEWHGDQLRRMDMWLANQWLTCDDNWIYVRHVVGLVERTATRVRSGGASFLPFPDVSPAVAHRRLRALRSDKDWDDALYFQHRIFDWGPTTDNVIAFLFPKGSHLAITLEFWREEHLRQHPEHVGEVFVAEIGADELAEILESAAAQLDRQPTRPA